MGGGWGGGGVLKADDVTKKVGLGSTMVFKGSAG